MMKSVALSSIKKKTTNKDGKVAEIPLVNIENYNYIGTVYIGNPPQPTRGIFDTGSSNFWALSSECSNADLSKNYVINPD